MSPHVLIGFIWHAFPYTRESIRSREALNLPHWSDSLEPESPDPGGIVLLEDQGGWHRCLGHNGFLILTEALVPPPVPTGWLSHAADLPDGWSGSDQQGRITVISRCSTDDNHAVRLVVQATGGDS